MKAVPFRAICATLPHLHRNSDYKCSDIHYLRTIMISPHDSDQSSSLRIPRLDISHEFHDGVCKGGIVQVTRKGDFHARLVPKAIKHHITTTGDVWCAISLFSSN